MHVFIFVVIAATLVMAWMSRILEVKRDFTKVQGVKDLAIYDPGG